MYTKSGKNVKYFSAPTCGRGKSEVLYAWAHHAKNLDLPNGNFL